MAVSFWQSILSTWTGGLSDLAGITPDSNISQGADVAEGMGNAAVQGAVQGAERTAIIMMIGSLIGLLAIIYLAYRVYTA
jgi:hypothetical protein